ncbi:hypothetical protein, partial [Planosporangium flavigriseum]|uniref:hypothetical protein n=1 Tax=Planosporangium flavigriseum TaxID=373681 RepID=UPI0031D02AC8
MSTPRNTSKIQTGWRLESSLGAEIAVPATWAINDSGCGMTTRPSVVRAKGMATLCFTEEPPTKELAIIEESAAPEGGSATTINGAPATKGTKRLTDGRYAGWISVPSRHVVLDVRTRNAETTERILDSLQLVDTDHLGCQTQPADSTKTPNSTPAKRLAGSLVRNRRGARVRSTA